MVLAKDESWTEEAVRLLRKEIDRELESPILTGFVREMKVSCGKDSCRCSSGKPADAHGPYLQYGFERSGRFRYRSLDRRRLDEFRQALARHERVKNCLTGIFVLWRRQMLCEPVTAGESDKGLQLVKLMLKEIRARRAKEIEK